MKAKLDNSRTCKELWLLTLKELEGIEYLNLTNWSFGKPLSINEYRKILTTMTKELKEIAAETLLVR